MTPKELVLAWVDAFNAGDADRIGRLYAEQAINHQVANEPVNGRDAITAMFREEFARAEMVCLVENLFNDGDWAILEWKDPLDLRGCGFFQIKQGLIVFQRGYWDKLSFLRAHKLPVTE
jgi:limonene-1,2-epoxide hydrolase